MLALAGDKVEADGWKNVRLVEADAETLELDECLDGILCFYTHDIMVSPTALPRALQYLKPGGRVVAAGAKLARGWRGWLIWTIFLSNVEDYSLLGSALRRGRWESLDVRELSGVGTGLGKDVVDHGTDPFD